MSDIKIVIGADVGQATAGLKTVQTELGKTAAVSGAAQSAFKGIGSQIASVGRSLLSGGIITGIALIGAAVIKLVSSLFTASAETQRLKAANEELSKSFLKAADNAAQEISKVTVLKAVLESENSTRLQKITALEQLKKINPDYFGQLDIEKGKVVGLDNAYAGYVQKLIRSINAKANVSILTEALEKQARALAKINQNVSAGKLKFQAENLTEFQVQDAIRRFGLSFGAGKGQSVIIDFDQKQLIADLLNAEDEVKGITNLIKENIQDAFNPKPEKLGKLEVAENFKSEVDRVLGSVFAPGKVKAPDKPLTVSPKVIVSPTIEFLPGKDEEILAEINKWLRDLKVQELSDTLDAKLTTAFEDGVASAFDSIGEELGNLVSEGKFSLPNLFGNLMSNLGQQIQELGKFLVTSSGLIKAAKEAFKNLLANPVASLVVGAGLIALGAILKSQARKQYKGFATGVRDFQGGFATVGERGPETIFLPRGSSVQPNNEMLAYGGGGVTLQPSLSYDGTRFRIFLDRVDQQMGRNN